MSATTLLDPRDRLLDWLTFDFEGQWVGKYVSIPANKELGKKRMDVLWKILDHAFPSSNVSSNAGVTECILIAWPNENYGAVGDAATAKYFLSKRGTEQPDVKEGQDAWKVVRAWLQPDDVRSQFLSAANSPFRVFACYFSFTDGRNLVELSGASELVERPVFRRNPATGDLEEWSQANGWYPVSADTLYRDHPCAKNARYYQRIAIGFGCASSDAADRVAAAADQLISALVLTWTLDLQEKRGESQQQTDFAHRTLEMIESIRLELITHGIWVKLPPTTRAAIIMLLGTVGMYRRTQHNPTLPFRGLTDESAQLHTYLELASTVATMRCQRNKNVQVQDIGESIRDHRDGILQAMQSSLNWHISAVPRGSDATIATESFAIMLIHCLGQSLYHSIRTFVEDRDCFQPPKILFRNAGTQLEVQIYSPGRPTGHVSKDVDQLKQLAAHFIPSGNVEGPAYLESQRMWLTAFSLRILNSV